MHKTIFSIILSLALVACNNNEVDKLQKKVKELEIINIELKDSIVKLSNDKLQNAEIIAIASKPDFKIGDTAKVKFKFIYPEILKSYDVYTVRDGFEPDSLLLRDLTLNEFEYSFVPQKLGWENVDLIAVFKNTDGEYESLNIPVSSAFKITE